MKKDEKRQLKRKKFYTELIAAGLISSLIIGQQIYRYNHFTLSEVQAEIDIHSGIGEDPSGHHIDPFAEHGCEVPNDGRTFEERLAEKMYEEGYHQETVEAAIEKFELQCDGEFKMAKDIKLGQIEQLAKENSKHR